MSSFTKVLLLFVASLTLFVGGCSAPTYKHNGIAQETPSEIDRVYYYDAKYAQRVVNAATQIQNKRYQDAWTKGPSDIVVKYHQLRGTNPYENWSPDVENPIYEVDTLDKYKDALAVANIFEGTEANVKITDALTIVSIPNSWLWLGRNSGTDFNSKAKRHVAQISEAVASDKISVFVKVSYPEYDFGVTSMSKAVDRADQVARILSDGFKIPMDTIKTAGMAYNPNKTSYDDKEGVSQIFIRHNLATNSQRVLNHAKEP